MPLNVEVVAAGDVVTNLPIRLQHTSAPSFRDYPSSAHTARWLGQKLSITPTAPVRPHDQEEPIRVPQVQPSRAGRGLDT